MSRETFGKVFKALTARNFARYYSIFDIYQNKLKGQIAFDSFYVGFLVFKDLKLISALKGDCFVVEEVKSHKKNLNESALYNKLLLLKNTLGDI